MIRRRCRCQSPRLLALVVSLGFVLGGTVVEAQVRPDERLYPPLYRGLGSQGGEPDPQSPDPTFFFEEKANWAAMVKQIPGGQPRTAWEWAQRGMYKQDELEDLAAAVEDYLTSERMNPRILIVQARLGVIRLKEAEQLEHDGAFDAALTAVHQAIGHLEFVFHESPFHQGIPFLLGEAHEVEHIALRELGRVDDAAHALEEAERMFEAELKLAPGSQRTHRALAALLIEEGRAEAAIGHLDTYLCMARLHSDPYPLRILQARRTRRQLAGDRALDCGALPATGR